MKKTLFRAQMALLSAALLIATGLAITAAPRKASSKAGSTKTAAKAPVKKKATKKASSTRSRSRKSTRSKNGGQSWRSRQLAPDPERYRQIQDALIAKGYLDGPATGQWDPASVDALRRFQKEQNLDPDGKIDSLSLIALGLGPKYDTAAIEPPPLAQQPSPVQQPAQQEP